MARTTTVIRTASTESPDAGVARDQRHARRLWQHVREPVHQQAAAPNR